MFLEGSMENNSSNNKATGALVIFGAPLAVLARNGWEIGLALIFLFLILYFEPVTDFV